VIEVRGLTKRYGRVLAVDALSFDVRPGVVTGFLGPNGSGKSTTMRLMLGLDAPDRGAVRIAGRRYRELGWPLREVGALLETRAFHPGRSARAHLAALAASNAIPFRRVDEVLGHHRRRAVGPVRLAGGRVPGADRRQRRVPREDSMTSIAVTRGHYRFWQVARMEWIKLRTLRSTWWTVAIVVKGPGGI
jgi:energy-coupling factor transporter ATP-binding protein EcfA2